MTLHTEINNPEAIAFIKAEAKRARVSPEKIVEDILVSIAKQAQLESMSVSERYQKIRETLRAKNGGKLFSDSTEVIRQSRLHDH